MFDLRVPEIESGNGVKSGSLGISFVIKSDLNIQ